MLALRNARNTAIEMTAAGMEDANVRPTFKPRYTLAAVKTSVMAAPNRNPRRVSSVRGSIAASCAFCGELAFESGENYKARGVNAAGFAVSPVILACLRPLEPPTDVSIGFDRIHSDLSLRATGRLREAGRGSIHSALRHWA